MLTQERLRKLMTFDQIKGMFYWNPPYSGKRRGIAGSKGKDGYVRIGIDGQMYYAHKLAFLYMEGTLPVSPMRVWHKNGDKRDNRWVNLEVQDELPSPRASMSTSNPNPDSPVYNGETGKWSATLTLDGETYNMGEYEKEDDARIAINQARVLFTRTSHVASGAGSD